MQTWFEPGVATDLRRGMLTMTARREGWAVWERCPGGPWGVTQVPDRAPRRSRQPPRTKVGGLFPEFSDGGRRGTCVSSVPIRRCTQDCVGGCPASLYWDVN